MTTVHPPTAPPLLGAVHAAPADASSEIDIREDRHGIETGERIRRLEQRRRLLREQIMVALFLLAALAATVAVLAMQWLESAPSNSLATAGAITVSLQPAQGSLSNQAVFYESQSGGFALIHSAGMLR